MAERNPSTGHRGAFTRGWKAALAVLSHERAPYGKPDKNTWQAIGYRHGIQSGMLDDAEMESAWIWSVQELQRVGQIDETTYK